MVGLAVTVFADYRRVYEEDQKLNGWDGEGENHDIGPEDNGKDRDSDRENDGNS